LLYCQEWPDIICLESLFASAYRHRQTVIGFIKKVAVDNILIKLLTLGFSDFVRVGSLKKIAKSILPFVAQTKQNSLYSQDLKDLYEMLEDENLAQSEKKGLQFES
jgi:hypothetical protein